MGATIGGDMILTVEHVSGGAATQWLNREPEQLPACCWVTAAMPPLSIPMSGSIAVFYW